MSLAKSHPYKSIRLRQLRSFCACVRHQSYSAGARAIGASQPVVWEQVRALERTFGVTLLLRRGRLLVPTEDGTVFFDLASRVVAGMESLSDVFAERRAGLTRRLVVAGATSVMIEDLAVVAATFMRERKDVLLSVLAQPNAQVVELVANGEADLGVVQFGRLDELSPLLTSEVLYHRPWFLFAPARHPLLSKRKLTLADLVAHPLILEAVEFPWRQLVDEQFRRAELLDRVRVAAEVNNALAARRFVGLGLGITILPRPAKGVTIPGVVARPLGDLFPPEHVVLLWRKGATPKPSARQFADRAKEILGTTSSIRPSS